MKSADQYTDDELQELAAAMPRHPNDNRIAYGQNDPSIIVPLLHNDFLKAIIVPCNDKIGFTNTSQMASKRIWERSKSWDTAITPETFTPQIVENIQSCKKVIHHYITTTSTPCNYQDVYIEPLIHEQGSGKSGIAPAFHVDASLTGYFSAFGGQLEYIAGILSPQQFSMTRHEKSSWPRDRIIENAPSMEPHLHRLNHGDIIYFNSGLRHRSSAEIPELGQIAFTITPT